MDETLATLTDGTLIVGWVCITSSLALVGLATVRGLSEFSSLEAVKTAARGMI